MAYSPDEPVPAPIDPHEGLHDPLPVDRYEDVETIGADENGV